MAKKKTWREKLEDNKERKVVPNPKGLGTLLIPKPLDVDALMHVVKKGKLITITQIRERLARDYGGDIACPLVTGIFIRIAAETAEEDMAGGAKDITPYWRTLKADGGLNDKLPGGAAAQAARLAGEGHVIEADKNGRPKRVKDYQGALQEL